MIYTSSDRSGEDREEGAWKRQKCENRLSTLGGLPGNNKNSRRHQRGGNPTYTYSNPHKNDQKMDHACITIHIIVRRSGKCCGAGG